MNETSEPETINLKRLSSARDKVFECPVCHDFFDSDKIWHCQNCNYHCSTDFIKVCKYCQHPMQENSTARYIGELFIEPVETVIQRMKQLSRSHNN